jgi:hypothetical protein
MLLSRKKGQSNEGGMLIWIVVAIIAAIVVILFFTGGFGVFSNLFKQAPQTLEAATQACKLVASPETRTSFCDQWREVDIAGVTQLVNCQYSAIYNQLDLSSQIECRSADGNSILNSQDKGKEYCKALFKNGKITEKTMVNDNKCVIMGCVELGGTLSAINTATPASSCTTDKRAVLKGFAESKDQACCLPK